jgi:hypothetical protein
MLILVIAVNKFYNLCLHSLRTTSFGHFLRRRSSNTEPNNQIRFIRRIADVGELRRTYNTLCNVCLHELDSRAIGARP